MQFRALTAIGPVHLHVTQAVPAFGPALRTCSGRVHLRWSTRPPPVPTVCPCAGARPADRLPERASAARSRSSRRNVREAPRHGLVPAWRRRGVARPQRLRLRQRDASQQRRQQQRPAAPPAPPSTARPAPCLGAARAPRTRRHAVGAGRTRRPVLGASINYQGQAPAPAAPHSSPVTSGLRRLGRVDRRRRAAHGRRPMRRRQGAQPADGADSDRGHLQHPRRQRPDVPAVDPGQDLQRQDHQLETTRRSPPPTRA